MQTATSRQGASALIRRHRHLAALCTFAVVIGGVYASVLDGTRSLITNGPWSQPLFVLDPLAGGPATAPLTRLAALSWLHGTLPVFDPFQGFGIPLLADQGVPVYLPQLLFHLAFPANYSIWNVVNLVALAFGVYLLASAFGQRFPGAIAAGFLAALAGAAPPNVNMSMLNPLAVLPFALVAVRYALDPSSRHRFAALLGISTAIAFLCLSGFQEVLPLMAAVIIVYAVALAVHFGTWRTRPALIAGAVGAAAGGVIVGSVGIVPVLSVLSGGTTVNGAGSYWPHSPVYWLSTLTLPTITGRALNQAPQDAGNIVFTVGTPLLVLVVVLALAISLRRGGRHTRWYVFPSVVLVVYGVLGYADIGHVLQLFDVPILDAIQTRRFLQFAWWVPLCLLLGAVVSNARVLRWKDALVALLAAGGFDAYFFVRYRQALTAAHVADGTPSILHAPIVAAAVVVVFLAAALAARRFGPVATGLVMAAIVLGSCIYDLPTNFPPSSFDSAVRSVHVPGTSERSGDGLVFFGIRQLPTEQYSFQIYGPIVPTAYREAVTALFSVPQSGGRDPVAASLPTLSNLTLTPRAVSVLRSFGVDLLVVSQALSSADFPAVPRCGSPPATRGRARVCFLGKVVNPHPGVAYTPPVDYAYRIVGAHALVQRGARLVPVASTTTGLDDFTAKLSTSSTALGHAAYVTSSMAQLKGARGVRGVSRQATSQTVSIRLDSRSGGLVVLRESYEPGVRASVNGRSVRASSVDGGLWTAVHVTGGASEVVLDYATTADLVEFGLAAAGLVALALAWLALGVSDVRRRVRRVRAWSPPSAAPTGGSGPGGPTTEAVPTAQGLRRPRRDSDPQPPDP